MNYFDFDSENCQGKILDFKLFDIPNTIERNIKACSELGAKAVTIADHPLNRQGIERAIECSEKYGIEIIIGDIV